MARVRMVKADLRDQWFAFHDQEVQRLTPEWLETEGTDPVLAPHGEQSPK